MRYIYMIAIVLTTVVAQAQLPVLHPMDALWNAEDEQNNMVGLPIMWMSLDTIRDRVADIKYMDITADVKYISWIVGHHRNQDGFNDINSIAKSIVTADSLMLWFTEIYGDTEKQIIDKHYRFAYKIDGTKMVLTNRRLKYVFLKVKGTYY